MSKKIKWPSEVEKMLDDLMISMKQGIVDEVELFAEANNSDEVSYANLEMGLYKAVLTLNETNKCSIIKNFGMEKGIELISMFENQARSSLTDVIIEDMKKDFGGEVPPEIQEMLDVLDKIRKLGKDYGRNE